MPANVTGGNTEPPHVTAHHRMFNVVELVDLICSKADLPSLATLARTSHWFLAIATRRLYETSKFRQIQHLTETVFSSESASAVESWRRFEQYSSVIRTLKWEDTMSTPTITPVCNILQQCPSLPVFPALHTIQISVFNMDDLVLVPVLFRGGIDGLPNLTAFELSCTSMAGEDCSPEMESVLQELTSCAPNLTVLCIRTSYFDSAPLPKILKTALNSLLRLRELTIVGTHLTEEVLRYVVQYGNCLTKLDISVLHNIGGGGLWEPSPTIDARSLPSLRSLSVYAPLLLMDCLFPLLSVPHLLEFNLVVTVEARTSHIQLFNLAASLPIFQSLKKFHVYVKRNTWMDWPEAPGELNLGPATVWSAVSRAALNCREIEDFSLKHFFADGTTVEDACIISIANAWPKLRSLELWWQNNSDADTDLGCSFASFVYLSEHCPFLSEFRISTLFVHQPNEVLPTPPVQAMRPFGLELVVRDIFLLDIDYVANFLASSWSSVRAYAPGVPTKQCLEKILGKMRMIRKEQASQRWGPDVVVAEQDSLRPY